MVEKALFHVNPEVQHAILAELFSVPECTLHHLLQDSFGNYIIQSSIALATFRDVFFINEKLRKVLTTTPYGHKIEARLDRRLKGKPVGTRSPLVNHRGTAQTGSATSTSKRAERAPKGAAATSSAPAGETTVVAADANADASVAHEAEDSTPFHHSAKRISRYAAIAAPQRTRAAQSIRTRMLRLRSRGRQRFTFFLSFFWGIWGLRGGR